MGYVLPTVRTTGEEADSGSTPHLEKIRLVDVYKGSIWGPRVRRSDVIEAGMKLWGETRSDSGELLIIRLPLLGKAQYAQIL